MKIISGGKLPDPPPSIRRYKDGLSKDSRPRSMVRIQVNRALINYFFDVKKGRGEIGEMYVTHGLVKSGRKVGELAGGHGRGRVDVLQCPEAAVGRFALDVHVGFVMAGVQASVAVASGHKRARGVLGTGRRCWRQINGSLGPAPHGSLVELYVFGARGSGDRVRSLGGHGGEHVVHGPAAALAADGRGRFAVPVRGQRREPFDSLLHRPERLGSFHGSVGLSAAAAVFVVLVFVRALRAGRLLVVLEERVHLEVFVDEQAARPSGRLRHDARRHDGRVRVVRALEEPPSGRPAAARGRRRRRCHRRRHPRSRRLRGHRDHRGRPGGRRRGRPRRRRRVAQHFVEVLQRLFHGRDHLVRRLGTAAAAAARFVLGRRVLLAIVLFR